MGVGLEPSLPYESKDPSGFKNSKGLNVWRPYCCLHHVIFHLHPPSAPPLPFRPAHVIISTLSYPAKYNIQLKGWNELAFSPCPLPVPPSWPGRPGSIGYAREPLSCLTRKAALCLVEGRLKHEGHEWKRKTRKGCLVFRVFRAFSWLPCFRVPHRKGTLSDILHWR